MPNRIVFGVEKPRLTLTEMYAEVTNDPADPGLNVGQKPTLPAHYRFWAELQNPTVALTGSPLGTGAVKVRDVAGGVPYSPYRIEIVRNTPKGSTANVTAFLRDPALGAGNVTGTIAGAPVDLTFDFSSAGAGQDTVPPANGIPNNGILVCAANVPMLRNAQEFQMPAAPIVISAGPAIPLGGPPSGSMSFQRPMTDAYDADRKNIVVTLRRLANPYLPPELVNNTNPYITVDFMDNVPVFDALQKKDGEINDRSPKSATNPDGYDPIQDPGVPTIARRTALGKVQPYAGMCNPGPPIGDYATFTFPNSLVVAQSPVDAANADVVGVRQTLGRANTRSPNLPAGPTYNAATGMAPAFLNNGTIPETLMTPYDWFVHLDRPLINQMELLHVTGVKPHEATLQFMVPKAPALGPQDVLKYVGTAPWLQNFPITASGASQYTLGAAPAANALYRALDVLRVQPFGYSTSGRVMGKININTIQDKRVWDALFDASIGNGFTKADVDQMWNALILSRTGRMEPRLDAAGQQLVDAGDYQAAVSVPGAPYLTPVPRESVYDMNTVADGGGVPYDRPFLPFGAPQLAAGSTFAFGHGPGIDDTLLRRDQNTGQPLIAAMASNPPHPYQRAEAVRKILNNTTTVSNVFAVWVTVGYFQVVPGTNGEDSWGPEYFVEVPGDARQKLFAIVDRTRIGLDPVALTQATPVIQQAQGRTFFTTVESNVAASATPTTINVAVASGDVNAVQVYSDGVAVNIVPSLTPNALSTLVIGTGADREVVSVTAVAFTPPTPTTPAFATLTVASLAKNHSIGDCVSNMIPGNPGPQNIPALPMDPSAPYGMVIPYWSKVQ
jgi:hypothetical protein